MYYRAGILLGIGIQQLITVQYMYWMIFLGPRIDMANAGSSVRSPVILFCHIFLSTQRWVRNPGFAMRQFPLPGILSRRRHQTTPSYSMR
jgi:hypothetical protein